MLRIRAGPYSSSGISKRSPRIFRSQASSRADTEAQSHKVKDKNLQVLLRAFVTSCGEHILDLT